MFWNKKKKEVATVYLNEQTFEQAVYETDKPVLVDFFATWCGPCRVLGPFVDELATEYKDKALVAKVDIDANPKIAEFFKIKSIPTILFFNRGELVEKYNGMLPKPNMAKILDDYIADNQSWDEEE